MGEKEEVKHFPLPLSLSHPEQKTRELLQQVVEGNEVSSWILTSFQPYRATSGQVKKKKKKQLPDSGKMKDTYNIDAWLPLSHSSACLFH